VLRLVVLVVVAVAAVAGAIRLLGAHARGRHVAGGILIENAGFYDLASRVLLGPYYRSIARDISGHAWLGDRVLEVGCGAGHLANMLAARHGVAVTGLDLDPQMVERALANARRTASGNRRAADFVVGDVAALPFDDDAFDLVVSTLSMHHWSDPRQALREIGRVLRPGGCVLIWDFRPDGLVPFHAQLPDPVADVVADGRLRLVSVQPWRWPWRFALSQRLELERVADQSSSPPTADWHQA